MGKEPTTAEEKAQIAYDKLAIMHVTAKISQAQDDRDFAGYQACFTETILIDQPMVPGWKPTRMTAAEWTNNGLSRLSEFDATHHRLSNHEIYVDGEEAACVVDLSAVHLMTVDGELKTWTLGGRYHMRLQRQDDGRWLISERALKVRYQFGDLSLIDKANAKAEAKKAAR